MIVMYEWLTSVCVLLSVKPFFIPCSALSNCRVNSEEIKKLTTEQN